MRYLCVLLIVLGLPLTASAQHQPRPTPPPPGSMGSIGLPLPAIGLPMTVPYQKPWEWTVPAPAWERNQTPAWEKQRPPAWERGPRPSQPIHNPRERRRPGRPVYPIYGIGYSYGVPYVMAPAVAPGAEPPPAPPAPPPALPPIREIVYVRVEVPAAPVVVPTGSRTLYFIPGCYLGNVLPDKDRLPAGCDISRMKTHAPQ